MGYQIYLGPAIFLPLRHEIEDIPRKGCSNPNCICNNQSLWSPYCAQCGKEAVEMPNYQRNVIKPSVECVNLAFKEAGLNPAFIHPDYESERTTHRIYVPASLDGIKDAWSFDRSELVIDPDNIDRIGSVKSFTTKYASYIEVLNGFGPVTVAWKIISQFF